jgi:hypothetical protein
MAEMPEMQEHFPALSRDAHRKQLRLLSCQRSVVHRADSTP